MPTHPAGARLPKFQSQKTCNFTGNLGFVRDLGFGVWDLGFSTASLPAVAFLPSQCWPKQFAFRRLCNCAPRLK